MIRVRDNNGPRLSVDGAIDELLRRDADPITPEMVLAELAIVPEPAEEACEQWKSRIVRELGNRSDLIAVAPGGVFRSAATAFREGEFLIAPDGFEIEHGILVPGHRFAPFMAEEVFPSEAVLQESGARRKMAMRNFRANAEMLLRYHLFMGAESLFDFFVAESPENTIAARESANPELTLAVFDMTAFYRETGFTEGDALLVTVADYAAGRFSFRLDNGRERTESRRRKYREQFETALAAVLAGPGAGDGILDQLRMTLAGVPELMKHPALALDELLLEDSPAEIVFDDELSTLVWSSGEDDEADAGDAGVPDGISISAGATGSLEAMLPELKTALTPVEIDAFMLDCCRNYELDFNQFFSRAFGEAPLAFADAAQEAAFFNLLEERFEYWCDNYPRDFDAQSGSLRAEILDFLIERQALFEEYAGTEVGAGMDAEAFRTLAEAVLQLGEVLKILNHPEALPADFDYDGLRETVDRRLEDGAEAMNKFRGMLDEP